MHKLPSAKILIDCSLVPKSSWCWRPEWYCGSESIYGLLAKFGGLNVLSTREICELFAQKNPLTNKRIGTPHFPKVDLRFAHGIRIARLANVLGLDAAHIRMGFVDVRFPNASQMASSHLVWCPACLLRGFHCPTFQLNYTKFCPLHSKPLSNRCPKCASIIPYALNSTDRYGLFCCPNCHTDLAPVLRSPSRALKLDSTASTFFADHLEVIQFTDSLPTLIDACKVSLGTPHLPFLLGKPELYHHGSSYRQFVTDVLTSLSSGLTNQTQTPLHLVAPSATFFDRTEVQTKRSKFQIKTRSKKTTNSVAQFTDKRLGEAWSVYRAVRRHLWRHHVCQHRHCARRAMKTLWWDIEGEKLHSFCSTAQAFIRWRMQWEGRRIPASLDLIDKDYVPYGLLTWVSKDAPISLMHWSSAFESWVHSHLLGVACLDSFAGWLKLSAKHESAQYVTWTMREHEGFKKRHWACSGRGSINEPGLLFLDGKGSTETSPVKKNSRAHRCATGKILAKLKR